MNKELSIKVMNQVLEHLGIKVNQLAHNIGLNRAQAIYDVLNPDKNVGISKKMAERIVEKYPQINKTYLLMGEGEMLKARDGSPVISYTKGVPYYNVDFVGGFDLIINDQTVNPDYLIDFEKYNDATCWCNVTGHSMEPEITHGDIIAMKKIEHWESFLLLGEVYAIVTINDMRTIKRIGKSENTDCYSLIPTNKSPEYGTQDLPRNMIRYVYQVLGCMKRL